MCSVVFEERLNYISAVVPIKTKYQYRLPTEWRTYLSSLILN